METKKEKFALIDLKEYRLKHLEMPSTCNDYTPDEILIRVGGYDELSVETLCAAIENKCSNDRIKWYITDISPTARTKLAEDGWPSLYYAAQRNSTELLTMLLQNGVKVKDSPQLPLLAFVIIHSHKEAIDTTGLLKLLLAYGLAPKTIPIDMWERYLETPLETMPKIIERESSWCNSKHRPILAQSLHLTHRYLLHLASQNTQHRPRMLQIAEENNMTKLTTLSYFLIGQRSAADIVLRQVYAHVALNKKTPLVLAFAGASGHGKTELAKAMGELLSVKTCEIDCTKTERVVELFGSSGGYNRNEDGSKLNNFLAANSGKRSVVFMDEFEKTKKDVTEALLLLTQNGNYEDRRNNTAVDCTQTIWIFATNYGDKIIEEYYAKNIRKLDEKKRNKVDLRFLQASLTQEYRDKHHLRDVWAASYLSSHFPSPNVVAHRFLLQFATEIRNPIDLNPDNKRLVGHCRLSLEEDGKLCTELSNNFYSPDLGARSLKNAVDRMAADLAIEYSNSDTLVDETINKGPLQSFMARRIPNGADGYDVLAFADRAGGDADGDEEL